MNWNEEAASWVKISCVIIACWSSQLGSIKLCSQSHWWIQGVQGDPILSFSQTFSLKSACVGGSCPKRSRLPKGKSWICLWYLIISLSCGSWATGINWSIHCYNGVSDMCLINHIVIVWRGKHLMMIDVKSIQVLKDTSCVFCTEECICFASRNWAI